MILIWSVLGDSVAAAVAAAVERLGSEFRFFDQHDAAKAELEISVGLGVTGWLRLPNGHLKLEEISGVYVRPHESRRLPAMAGAADAILRRAAILDQALLGWSEIAPARILNRPSAMASNNSKPYQSSLIQAQGFAIPETLVTTDKDALEAFWEKHGSIVYKSISGVRSIVTRMTPAHRQRFAVLANCPTQFQQWIPGTDFRAHVVGRDVFACRVESSATDYRYPCCEEDAPKIQAQDFPDDIRERCVGLAASLGLLLAGIDLRRTPDNRWFCFEVNPSPAFTYYEQLSGQPIADAVARLLATV
ncbi:MAG: RimK domain-containing protein ATP-grasp [Bryobacteraceae bacterium]|jgi:glutathione synthase/RimK-type ligase-like ATP-grasp enzyme